MRKRLLESFRQNEAQAMAAMARRWGNPKYVQDMIELLARLQGELNKEAGDGRGHVGVIILDNNGPLPLNPPVFREAAMKRVLEPRPPHPEGGSRWRG